MASTQDDTAERSAYWPVPVSRAVPAAGLALLITFSADHTAEFGLFAFGAFAIVSGLVVGILSFLRLRGSTVRSFLVAQAAVSIVLGILALVFHGGGTPALFLVITVFAAITGILELYCGLRTRRRYVASGDWMAVGIFTIVAALVFVLIPPEFRQVYTVDGTRHILDGTVSAVGLLGIYGAVTAVYLLIAGLSAKWGTQSKVAASVEGGSQA